jgi:hypothetical protein
MPSVINKPFMLSVIILNVVMLSVVVPLAQPSLLFVILKKLTNRYHKTFHFLHNLRMGPIS